MMPRHGSLAADIGDDNGSQSRPVALHIAELQQKHGHKQGGPLDEELRNRPLLDSMRSE